jgi:hypothetical protein
MKLPRRGFLHLAAAAATLPTVSEFASAQSYPTRMVHLIEGFGAGGAPDIVARLIGQSLSEQARASRLSLRTAVAPMATLPRTRLHGRRRMATRRC